MIIRFLRWCQPLFHKLVNYINQEKDFNPHDPDVVLHNIRNPISLAAIADEFESNDQERKNLRKNSVRANHEIIAFRSYDAKFLDSKTKSEIVNQYIKRRCPNAIVFGRWHFDREHPHLHLCISAVEYRDPQKLLRLDNKRFNKLRRDMELWQQREMPELSSIVYINKQERTKDFIEQDRNAGKQKKIQMDIRVEKQELFECLNTLINKSASMEDFHNHVLQSEINLYGYEGNYVGVQLSNGKKYRWETLKLTEQLVSLDKKEKEIINERITQMETLRNRYKTRERSILLER